MQDKNPMLADRRKFLARAGQGFGPGVLADLLADEGLLSSRAAAAVAFTSPEFASAGSAAVALSGKGQERNLALHERRAEPCGYVGLQAGTHEYVTARSLKASIRTRASSPTPSAA